MEKKILIVSGASGSGKDSIMDEIVKKEYGLKIRKWIPWTNRKQRNNETEGISYFFNHYSDFDKNYDQLRQNSIIRTGVGNNGTDRYGYDLTQVKNFLKSDDDILFVIADVDGKKLIEDKLIAEKLFKEKNILSVFIDAGEIKNYNDRMQKRNSETEADKKARIDHAAYQLSKKGEYKTIIKNENGKLENAVNEMLSLLKNNKNRILI